SDFTRMGSDSPEPISTAAKKPLHFSLNNIMLTGGSIDFTDQTSEKKSQHKIRELTLRVPFIGNIPYLTDDYVEPFLYLLLNGSEIRANGQLKPFHNSLETNLYLTLDAVDLAYYAFHSPIPLPLEITSGILDAHIDLAYRISGTEQPKLLLGGELALSDIDIRELDGKELFRMPTLILDLDWADLFQQDFNLLSLEIYDPQLYLDRDRNGHWNFQQLIPAQSTESPPEISAESKAAPAPLLLKIEQLELIDGQVHFRDDFPPEGFSEEVRGINLQLTDVSTHHEQKTKLAFKMQTDRELTTEVNGEIGINPPTADLDLLVNGIPLKPYYPYLAEFLTAPVEGNLNLASRVQYGADGNVQLQQARLALHGLKVPFGGKDAFSLTDLAITDGSFDLHRQQLSLDSVRLTRGDLRATRLADGSLSPLKLLRPQPAAAAPPTADDKKAAQPFEVRVGKVDLEQFKLLLTDAGPAKKPQLKIDELDVSLENLAYPQSAQSPFSLKARMGKRGSIALTGTLAHTPLRVQAQTQIKALSLADFNDFLPENVKVSLKDGKLYTTMAVELKEQPGALAGSFGGQVTISDFNLRDPLSEGKLLTWENLNLVGIKGEISPFKLEIKEVSLSNYLANIQIDPEGRINLTGITAAEQQEETAEPAGEEVAAVEDSSASEPPPDIRIDAVTLQGGTVSFTDRSMPNIFSATMYKLGGRITGLASDEQMQADVDLRGELENHSPLTIIGKLNPLSKDLYADLTIHFKDIDLTPMTPYSGTYLGYVIDKGKLYLDLSYHIEHRKIKAENNIMIDQFTFGDSVKSDKATSLPVGLAIALLKDSNDEIHLDIPISGDLNDPAFSIMGTVFTMLKNLLVKAATSPFSLLASMLGGEDEDFTNLAFAGGIARLDEKQQETLGKLAAMLAKRPSLTLEISAFADPDKDPEGYRQDQLQQLLSAAKWRELKEDGQARESREEVSISAEEYPKYLLTVYKEAEFPRPRNFIGMLKKLPDEEMEKLLLANIRAEDEQLQALAQARAQVVRDTLIAAAEEIKPRIFLKTVDIFQPPEKGVASRVEFAIGSK
ncbi:MAG: DUF748 domain-containing protein, partial [Desulfuromonadaceae bacterium]|nr:DUF748 domain-containing protein [Desulfuromonadaceae bacterium]